MTIGSVPGFAVLFPSGSYPGTSRAAATPDRYTQSYDQLTTWSSGYLLQSIESGAPAIPQYTGGQPVDMFAQLNTTLAALKTGIGQGFFTGTGFDALA